MKLVGVDLHKKTISLCVMVVVAGKREVVAWKRFSCRDTAGIRAFFERHARRASYGARLLAAFGREDSNR